MSTAASPAELTEQSQVKGSTAAEFSLLYTHYLGQNQLKWVPISDTVQEGGGGASTCRVYLLCYIWKS